MVDALKQAVQELLDTMSSTYKARNGRVMSIEADDGEMCYIVHSDQIDALRSTLSDAVAEREAEPVASVAEVRADGQRLYNTVYPSDALDKFPIGTLLYTSPPTSELEALRKRVAELEKALDGLLSAETTPLHVGYDNGVGGGNYVYADAIRIDCEEFVAARRVREGGKVE